MIARLATLLAAGALFAGCAAGGPGPARGPSGEPAPVRPPRAAEAVARSEPFALVPDGAPESLTLRVTPGARRELRLRVANGADRPRTLMLRASTPWISITPAVDVPARQSAAVVARLAVPADAAPGGVVVLVAAATPGRPGAALAVGYESAVRVHLQVVAP